MARRNNRGFSMIEIIAVISIIACVAAAAEPFVSGFMSSQRVATAAQDFIQDIRGARYSSMDEQVYYRCWFKADGTGYDIEAYIGGSVNEAVVATGHKTDAMTVYPSANWQSNADGMRDIDPEVTFTRPTNLNVIFFRPDGMLVTEPTDDALLIPDCIATFTYGGTSLAVNINGGGVRSTEEFYED